MHRKNIKIVLCARNCPLIHTDPLLLANKQEYHLIIIIIIIISVSVNRCCLLVVHLFFFLPLTVLEELLAVVYLYRATYFFPRNYGCKIYNSLLLMKSILELSSIFCLCQQKVDNFFSNSNLYLQDGRSSWGDCIGIFIDELKA